jgi:hypothetical protein
MSSLEPMAMKGAWIKFRRIVVEGVIVSAHLCRRQFRVKHLLGYDKAWSGNHDRRSGADIPRREKQKRRN